MLAVTILGNNSALPAHNRHPTSQVIQTQDHKFLVDCGEGTQMQMIVYKIRPGKINHIFISHLHGDHYFGLIGLLTSLGLNNRKNPLNIYSPEGLKEIIELQFKVADTNLSYPINFHILKSEGIIFEDKKLGIECFKVHHRIVCWGFIFREKKNNRKIDPEKVAQYNIPSSYYENLQKGNDYFFSSKEVIKNELLTTPGLHASSYAYCADTGFFERIAEKIKDVDLLYHESTYLHALEDKASARFHSTSMQAATIAKKANVKKLLLGHFSSMYESIDDFRAEACEIFENTECALEGVCYLA
ncbi:MAG TPA: ribonuclease Z [Chitinophagaceae bacterium]|nr:ribonuclease Z [Chitinophagaceae bacterium]